MRGAARSFVSFIVVAAAACSTGVPASDGTGAGEGEGEGEPDSACAVLAARCVACHSGGSLPVDLRPVALPALTGAASPTYPGHTLVVAGDPDASLLFQKMAGTQPAGTGGVMPPSGAVSAAGRR